MVESTGNQTNRDNYIQIHTRTYCTYIIITITIDNNTEARGYKCILGRQLQDLIITTMENTAT